jgi:hypothetical protein
MNSVTWTQLLASNEVQRHQMSTKELDKLRAVIRRDLADASVDGASAADVSPPPTMRHSHSRLQNGDCMCWLSCRRCRTPQDSFDVVKLTIGKAADPCSDYFGRCRRKRNVIDYDDAFVATETEATEILTKAKEFAEAVEHWIAKNHPLLKA